MHAELLLLRVVHILCGIFWLGSALFTALFLAPALSTPGANAGVIFAALGKRKLFVALPTAAVLTIASGARLMAIASGGFAPAYMDSPVGRTLAFSGAAAIVAFLLSLLIARPAGVRASQLMAAAAAAPEGERGRLVSEAAAARRRGGIASVVTVSLLVLAAAGMSVARYV